MPESGKRIRSSRDGLLRQLESAGFNICTFEVSSTGNYCVEDADWNYKDVPHLNVVHTKVRAIVGSMDDDVITTLNLQKIFGIAVPVTLVNYATSESSQTYFTTLGPFILVVRTSYAAVGVNRTEVTTQYNIAASGLARLFFPVLKRILKSNYRTLMSEDLPMRNRRGDLRARGIHFKTDGRPRTFGETTDLLFENVLPPQRTGTHTESVPLTALAADGESIFVGPDDDRGVRIMRRGEDVLVLPRYCSHEGASLDCSSVRNGSLTCPWHAKRVPPLARLASRNGEAANFWCGRVSIEEGLLTVTLPSDGVLTESTVTATR